jgi:dynein heavy chain
MYATILQCVQKSFVNFKAQFLSDFSPTWTCLILTLKAAKKASGNVAGLCSWVRSMSVYYVVDRDIAPKIAALQVAESQMKSANSKLQKVKE